LLKLSLKLKQLPRRYFHFDDDPFINERKIGQRKRLVDFSCDNDFENYIASSLFKNIPYSYLEGFSILKEKALKTNLDCNIIFTSNAHFSNDFFKVWCAEKVCFGNSKLFISTHGGAIPSAISPFIHHEEMVSDKRIVWHKALSQKQVKLPPNKFPMPRQERPKNTNGITIVGLELGLYGGSGGTGPYSSLLLEDFSQKQAFIQSLPVLIQEEVKVLPYKNVGWETKARYIDIFGAQIISPYGTVLEAIRNSKIMVCTYPQTTFSEIMHSNVPAIMLYVNKYWDLEPEFDDLLLLLMEAKIIFTDEVLAAEHINDIFSNPDNWWESDLVVEARNFFHEQCLTTSNNWLNEWHSFFKKVN
jgi:putative transferase (TIGR04331 family)